MTQQRTRQELISTLLERHGRTYCEELAIDIDRGTPSPLFRWLCASILFSARIRAEHAARAARALADRGWTTPGRMAAATWAERTRVLNEAGYAHYDESTSRKLGDASELILRAYGGDLRRLRERAGREPEAERRLLDEIKGLGPVGTGIFCREVQNLWEELFPFVDRKAEAAARSLGLPTASAELAALVERRDFPRLVAALVRTSLARDSGEILKAASVRARPPP